MNKIHIPIALTLIGIGLILQGNFSIPWISKVSEVCIIKETKDNSKLPNTQIALMNSVSFIESIESQGIKFLGCFDKDIVDRNKEVPKELKEYIEAANELGVLPALVYKRGNNITAIPLPDNKVEALEKLQ